MNKIKQYFDNHPGSNQCFQTSDGFIFHDENSATNHAKTLEDKKVSKHERSKDKPENKSSKEGGKAEPGESGKNGKDAGEPK